MSEWNLGKQVPGATNKHRRAFIILLLIVSTILLLKCPSSKLITSRQKCTTADGKEDIMNRRFGIVLDAGSTGSRIHIYKFKYCGQQMVNLEDEIFEQVKPGLSHYAENPEEAARSLRPLLSKARSAIPRSQHKCTPLVLKATAGLRLLKPSQTEAILGSVRWILSKQPFHIGPLPQAPHVKSTQLLQNSVAMIDGNEEGLLAWLTVKFLQSNSIQETPVVLDLGGGSTQIVFQVDSLPADGSFWNKYYSKQHFAGQDHYMYQHSYLGYGLKEARKTIMSEYSKTGKKDFPCLPIGFSTKISGNSNATLSGSSDWSNCESHVHSILFQKTPCQYTLGCSFNNTHQPEIPPTKPVLAFSYFNDRLSSLNLTDVFTVEDIKSTGKSLCSEPFIQDSNPMRCMDVVYIYSLLAHGYGLKSSNPISCTKKINGFEAGWALGSAVQVLGQSGQGSCLAP